MICSMDRSFTLDQPHPHRFSIAPMMAWTDRHCRFFLRLITKSARLYTEMVPMNALLKGNQKRFLDFNTAEHPVALQLGGSDPSGLARAARIAERWGYDEVNLNVGCPSPRVTNGHFGACLMAEPALVEECVAAMVDAVSVSVTVKCRIGIDEMDIEGPLNSFISRIAQVGCKTVIIHARKAWLKGLSPEENRTLPPLDYERVYRLKDEFPELNIVINGGIKDITEVEAHLQHVDGVMIGRAAYETPYVLADVDHRLFGHDYAISSQIEIAQQYANYCQAEVDRGTALHHLTKHILGLFKGCPGARAWRRYLSTNACRVDAQASIIYDALNFVEDQSKVA